MTILSIAKDRHLCPVCEREAVVLILDAPQLWMDRRTLQYSCAECLEKAAQESGEAIRLVAPARRDGRVVALAKERGWLEARREEER